MRTVLVGALGFLATLCALAAVRGLPEAHAQAAAKTLRLAIDPTSSSVAFNKSGPMTTVSVLDASADFQVLIRGTVGTCRIHTASLGDALALKAQINGAQTTQLLCMDQAGQYNIPAAGAPGMSFTLDASP
jgi:hypothetical protein